MLSETHARAKTTERPMQYADKRFSGSSDSSILIPLWYTNSWKWNFISSSLWFGNTVSLRNNDALATHRERSDSGVCFTNRPLKVEEKVHIRGTHYCYGAEHHIFTKLGLTDINPDTIREAVDKKEAIGSALTPVQCCDYLKKRHEHLLEVFHLCILLLPNACLAISLNDAEQKAYDCQIDSTYYPLWLVIELGVMASIWISHV